MLGVLLVGMPVILGNMLLQSRIIWSVRYYLSRLGKPCVFPLVHCRSSG